ncbi:MAG: DUF4956 domain-containing protein [Clostridia bacterium]|nr:DUF4956 domain-containing protein [Clostridia bacterium]
MSFSDIFKKGFLTSYANTEITFRYAVLAMLICLAISLVICAVYYFKSRKYFFSKEFAVSLVALSVITVSVILTIQASVVVSLGMVGALSIVRFRTAIKNPLDLVFLFWSIATGIICGAGLYFIALPLTLILGIAILLSDEVPGVSRNRILVLDGSYPYDEGQTMGIVRKYAKWYNVRTESVHNDAVNLIIEVRKVKDSQALIRELRQTGVFQDVSLLVQEGTID